MYHRQPIACSQPTAMLPDLAAFGPFRLSPAARFIERDGEPVVLGDRALDLLIVLVERAGSVVSHAELMRRVWRGLVVTPGNLRVHMALLRRALGDGLDGARYIENVVGQGYCFVAPVSRATCSPALPPALARMLVRPDTIDPDARTTLAVLLALDTMTLGR